MTYGYINQLSSNVQRDHIKFHNRFNTTLAGDLLRQKHGPATTSASTHRRGPLRRG